MRWGTKKISCETCSITILASLWGLEQNLQGLRGLPVGDGTAGQAHTQDKAKPRSTRLVWLVKAQGATFRFKAYYFHRQ